MDGNIRSIKQRFSAINRERLRRTKESLRWKQRDFLDLLPLLFHLNHPMLPGYVSKSAPSGVSDYAPTKRSLEAAKRFTKTFEYKKRAMRTYDIWSIFLMGSTGTVAHSEKSDFDIWICHRSDMDVENRSELIKKGNAIEEWAGNLNLEVHFFLMDAISFKKGEHVDLSSESSGTAQHHLLLEEFYRTGLLVAGRMPAWWLVPPENEKNYDKHIDSIIKKRFITENDIIDFGGLHHIPAEEFFGAALWQVYKGIDSPYKSVLKILLMEIYAQEYPNIELLSMRYKKAVYAGEINLDRLDPYIMLMRKIEEYLEKQNEEHRLDLVRRCFYFKIGMQISVPVHIRNITWRRELMEALIHKWDWDDDYLVILDSRESWKIHRVLQERKIVVDELTNSFLFLSGFARKNAQLAHISQKDLNILGRKLYAAFERKAGKIEIVNRGIAPNLVETHLQFQQVVNRDGKDSWMLFHGTTGTQMLTGNTPTKRSLSFISLLAWCHFNKLMNARTVISLRTQSVVLEMKEVDAIIKRFQTNYPEGDLPHVDMEALSKPPEISSTLVFINTGVDPMARHTRNGNNIISNKNDALNYSGFSINLALTFDQIIVTSWQEVLTFTYSGISGLLDCICNYLQWNRETKTEMLPPVTAFSFSSTHGNAISRRIEELFKDIVVFYTKSRNAKHAIYTIECEQSYYCLLSESGVLRYDFIESKTELIRYLGRLNAQFKNVIFDRHALKDTVLPLIYSMNKKNKVQLFYFPMGNEVDVYVLDERGSLFYQRMHFYDNFTLVNHFDSFFESVGNRQRVLLQNGKNDSFSLNAEFYYIYKNKNGRDKLEKQYSTRGLRPNRFFNIQVIGDFAESSSLLTVYCDDVEFSSIEYGGDLFKDVAKYVVDRRKGGQRYPIYITDIDLPPNMIKNKSQNSLQTTNFLLYKKSIEEKLNSELVQL